MSKQRKWTKIPYFIFSWKKGPFKIKKQKCVANKILFKFTILLLFGFQS